MSGDIVARLHAARRVHPQATLPWPHRMLSDAADEIARLRAALHDIARQPEGDEQSAQAVARECLGLAPRTPATQPARGAK